MTFEEIYQRVQNPLDNEQNLNKIIDFYKDSKRTGYGFESIDRGIRSNQGSMYDNIASAVVQDSSKYSIQDEEIFMVNLYNKWIKELTSLTPQQKTFVRLQYENLDGLIDVLNRVGKVENLQDIENLKKNPLVSSEKNNVETWQGVSFNHIMSSKVTGYKEDINGVKHRLYIGAKHKDVYKLANEFMEECHQKDLPYYFKFDANYQNRVDTLIIYSDDENFTNYINILNDIKKKYPDIVNDCGEPSLVAGNYDGWIGIAGEPPRYKLGEHKYDNPSFTQTRSVILEESLDRVVVGEYQKYLNNKERINYNGKERSISECFRYKLLEVLKEEAYRSVDSHPLFDFKSLSDNDKNTLRDKFIELINKFTNDDLNAMVTAFKNSIDGRWTQNADNQIHNKFMNKTVEINLSSGKKIEWGITPRIVDYAMKKMVDIFQTNNPDFTQEVRNKIDEVCVLHHADPVKFVFNSDTRTRMNNLFSNNSKQNKTTQFDYINNIVGDNQEESLSDEEENTDEVLTLFHHSKSLEDKIDYLKGLSFEKKEIKDFVQELNDGLGRTIEDLGCAYAIVDGKKYNVGDLKYTAIEKTLFEIVNLPDYDKAKTLLVDFKSVLDNAGYVPSYGTLGRTLQGMDKLQISDLGNKGARKDLLRDALGEGNRLLQDSQNICKYIKFSNNIPLPITNEEQAQVLLKMQDNYNQFGLQPDSNKPQNYKKLINADNVPKNSNLILNQKSAQEILDEENLHKGYRDYGFKSCPFSITDANGEKKDIWDCSATEVITNLLIAINSGDKNEIRKMRIVCENMQGHFNPSYADMAKLTKIINDYWKLNDNPEIDRAIDCLKEMSKDKYNEAFAISKFNAQKEGRSQTTYSEMVDVFKELEVQKLARKQAENKGYGDGM